MKLLVTDCYSTREFVCLNHRCIDSKLRCDGFNHCGDNSDEQTACKGNYVACTVYIQLVIIK